MGASWSSDRPDLPSQSKYPGYYGDVVPPVCSDRPEDLYDDLYDHMIFVQHASQDCIVAFQRCEKEDVRVDPEEWLNIAERVPRVYEYLAHSTNTLNVDVDQPIELHPRIVK